MPIGRLKLKFEDKGAGLVAGRAWVVAGEIELTADCATYSELDNRLQELEADIFQIRKQALKNFERVQGGGGRRKIPLGPRPRR